VKVDVSQFEQVVVNLAVNARDAMPDGGKLTVRTANVSTADAAQLAYKGMPAADYVRIDITDTGTGIPADIREKIFEPFFSTKEVGKGTGLGLSTVYGIVKQTGGFVYVDSEEGKGTSFLIFLPRHRPEQDTQAEAAAETQAAGGAKGTGAETKPARPDLTGQGTILLVEDEDGLRSLNARGLRSRGYSVIEAANGVEAMEALEEKDGAIDLVVSDVVMPEMDSEIDAVPQSRPEDHLRLRLCRGCLRKEPARERAVRLPAQTLHPDATGRCGEGNHDAAVTCRVVLRIGRNGRIPRLRAAAAGSINAFPFVDPCPS
jgi:two-component system cell cycle sensor histidine kinase/response regulator CckA